MTAQVAKPALFSDRTPLCVDLDHSLVNTDTLIESLLILLKKEPWELLKVFGWMFRGKAFFKQQIANRVKLNPALLPYNKEVLFFLKRMRKRGRPLYLITGSSQQTADDVASYLGIFEEAHGSSVFNNLTGESKAGFLSEKFGAKNFDYLGDSKVDLKVWPSAREAILVSPNPIVERSAKKKANVTKIITGPNHYVKTIVKTLRVHQWVKNSLMFLPVLTAHRYASFNVLFETFIGFLAFSATASLIYVINDLFDLEADRQHVDKKNRPFASGAMPLRSAVYLIPILGLIASLLVMNLNLKFAGVMAIYLVVTNLYTFILKKIPIADIITLSSLYSLRLIAGSAITGIVLSPWLIGFSGFFFLSLALVKRCSELLMLKGLGHTKTIGRGYMVDDIHLLSALGGASGYGAVVVFALYINSNVAHSLYKNNELLWLLCPLLIYWISRVWFLTNRRLVQSDPVRFALRDKVSWTLVALSAIIWLAAKGF